MKTFLFNLISTVGLNLAMLVLLVFSSKDLNSFYTMLLALIFVSQGMVSFYILSLRQQINQLKTEQTTKPNIINHRIFK